MSVDSEDIKQRYTAFYQRKVVINKEIISEDKLRNYNQRAKEAIYNENQRNRDIWVGIEQTDFDDICEPGITYEKEQRLFDFCGDTKISRFWWSTPIYYVDKTVGLTFWSDIIEDIVDEDWYTKEPEDFNKVQKVLTPWAERRQYGRVFFGTETRYIGKEDRVPLSAILKVKGYYKRGDEKIFKPFVRQPRSDLFKSPKAGTTSYCCM